jgi:xanthine dehydrogenase/oxidase
MSVMHVVAGRQIRNTGTLGGNIATASPISDLNPLWMAFGATFTVVSKAGTRTVPASKFFLAYRCVPRGKGRGV